MLLMRPRFNSNSSTHRAPRSPAAAAFLPGAHTGLAVLCAPAAAGQILGPREQGRDNSINSSRQQGTVQIAAAAAAYVPGGSAHTAQAALFAPAAARQVLRTSGAQGSGRARTAPAIAAANKARSHPQQQQQLCV